MKINFLMTGLLGLLTFTAVAQKAELATAQKEYGTYDGLKGNKAMGTLALKSLATAKASIDKASTDAKTSVMPLTWALKGSIYAALAFNETNAANAVPLLSSAEEALKKAKEIDTKNENTKLIDDAKTSISNYYLNKGAKDYNDKKYELAYQSFENFRQISPEDTTAIFYTALAAANYGNSDAAITNYKKLLTTAFPRKLIIYQDLFNIYLKKLDTVGAIKIMTEASEKFPDNADLSRKVLELNIQMGKQDEVLSKLETTIAKDPKNKTLYYYAGATYTQVARDASDKIKKTKDAATIAALSKTRDEFFKKAEGSYRKALEIDPNYFEANLNLGYVLITPAIQVFYDARNIPVTKQKEYTAAMAKANTMFDLAKPYLLKAVELQPTNLDALNNLRTYYLGKNDMTNANDIKKRIDGASATPEKK